MNSAKTLLLATIACATVAGAQSPPAVKSVPLPPPLSPTAQIIPSTEALTWSQKHLSAWPEGIRRLGAQLFTKYGAPAETTAQRVTWYDKAPWVRIALYKSGAKQNFAAPHRNVLEQAVYYKVPIEKLVPLAQFNRSVVPNLAAGEIASFSDSEALNFLSLNVADDIIKGERTVEQARTYFAQLVRAQMIHEPEADLHRLQFTPAKSRGSTADPDEVAPLIRHMNGADDTAHEDADPDDTGTP